MQLNLLLTLIFQRDVQIYALCVLSFHLQAVGSAPTRAYHSCNLFNGELLVFGGVFPNPDPQPDGCSNELYIFNTSAKNWYKPITSGTPPNPKSGYFDLLFYEVNAFKNSV